MPLLTAQLLVVYLRVLNAASVTTIGHVIVSSSLCHWPWSQWSAYSTVRFESCGLSSSVNWNWRWPMLRSQFCEFQCSWHGVSPVYLLTLVSRPSNIVMVLYSLNGFLS